MKPAALVILDGFGYTTHSEHNAIQQAKTPCFDRVFNEQPLTLCAASGQAVGLLPNMIGNSEVGHLTIGTGQIIAQPVTRIHTAITDKSLFNNQTLISALEKIKQSGGALHIMGLLSDTGIHCHEEHIYAYLQAARNAGIERVFVHAFLDGRDSPPQWAANNLERLHHAIEKIGVGTIGSLHGRWYAMDRDNNWERTSDTYRVLTAQQDVQTPWQIIIEESYAGTITDEFIEPTQCDANAIIRNGDGIICANFRSDRIRQLASCFVNQNTTKCKTQPIDLACFVTPFAYGANIKTTHLFEHKSIHNTLKKQLSAKGLRIFTIAETEKYAHVTYFFDGYREELFPGETRVMVPSIPTKTYVDNPRMSADAITKKIIESLTHDPHDFYLINYANADMVGHSGNMAATQKAIECLDEQIQILHTEFVEKRSGTLIITADHGNAEDMFDADYDQPRTAHTVNPVPLFVLQSDSTKPHTCSPETLADIMPCVLDSIKAAKE